jgi:DNA-binding PadR family transcriptional regulator
MVKTRPRLLSALATAHVQQGNVEEACRIGAGALALAEGQQVTTNLQDVRRPRLDLERRGDTQAVSWTSSSSRSVALGIRGRPPRGRTVPAAVGPLSLPIVEWHTWGVRWAAMPEHDFRMTTQTLRVLSLLLDDPQAEHYGLEISKRAGLPTGSVYPILARLEQHGWVEGAWEQIDPVAEGRRPRRYYRLTPSGAERARDARDEAMRLIAPHWRPMPGKPRTGQAPA